MTQKNLKDKKKSFNPHQALNMKSNHTIDANYAKFRSEGFKNNELLTTNYNTKEKRRNI